MPVVSAIVLAGGQSKRLGQDKAWLKLDGQTLIERVVTRVAQISAEVIVVTNSPRKFAHLEARLVSDVYPEKGPLVGIYSGLRVARHHYSLVVACDMPFINLNLLRHMIGLAPGYDVVIPEVDGFLEPLHAIYSKNCLAPIDRLLAAGGLKIIDFFPEVRVRRVEEEMVNRFDPQRLSFLNINTAADWERVKELVSSFPRKPPQSEELAN